MAYVLGGKIKGETWIEARGVKHRILFTVNQIKQEPIVKNIRSRSRVTTGTRVTMFWPDCCEARIDADEIADLLRQFIWVNPHLTLQVHRGRQDRDPVERHQPELDEIPCLRCDLGALVQPRAIRALCRRADRPRSGAAARDPAEISRCREFVAQFRGMSATDKQKQVLRELGASHMTLAAVLRFGDPGQSSAHAETAAAAAAAHAPGAPGIARRHWRGAFAATDDRASAAKRKSFKYFSSPGYDADGLPYVVEIATCPYKKWVGGKRGCTRQEVDHRRQFQRHPGKSVPDLPRHGRAWTRF